MGESDEQVLGARVREARERAGMTQGQLAASVDLDRTAMNKIESGSRKVTALELSDIAAALKVRMSSFFGEPVPALVSHRSSQGLDIADSQIDSLLANIATDVEFIYTLAATDLGLPASDAAAWPRPDTLAAADKLAVKARNLLGVDDAAPIYDLVEKFATIGFLAFLINLGVDTADAGTILLRRGGVSLVNSHNKIGRRRLALAHELGHFLVADEYTVDWRVADQHGGDIESRLDRFARSVLLPELGLRAAWTHNEERGLRDAAVLIASEFRVDMATLARRLEELGLIGSSEAASVRGVTTTRADIVEFGLYVPGEIEETRLPLPYQRAVLRAFRDEQISRERALELLHGTFADSDLPSLRARRPDELWKFVS